MSKQIFRLLCMLIGIILINSSAYAKREPYSRVDSEIYLTIGSDVTVQAVEEFDSGSLGGSIVLRLVFKNDGNEEVEFDAILIDDSYYGKHEVKKRIKLPAKDSRIVSLNFSKYDFGNSDGPKLVFESNGKEIGVLNTKLCRFYDTYGSRARRYILLDQKISNHEADRLFGNNCTTNSYNNEGYQCYYYNGGTDLLYTEWTAYSMYDALIFYDDTFEDIAQKSKEAIFDYVRAGGQLIVLGSDVNLPKDIRIELSGHLNDGEKFGRTKTVNPSFFKYYIGFGNISICNSDLFKKITRIEIEKPKAYEKEERKNYSSARRREPSKSEASKEPSESDDVKNATEKLAALREKKIREGYVANQLYDPDKVLDALNIGSHMTSIKDLSERTMVGSGLDSIHTRKISLLLLFFMILAIAVVMGPANFLVLRKKNKKIFVFVTVPILSVLCSASIFIYYFIFERSYLAIYENSVTYLDENTETAVTFGGISGFSGKNRDYDLSFPLTATVTPIEERSYRRRAIGADCKVSLDNRQRYDSGWIKSNIPFYFAMNSVEQTRARVEFSRNGNRLEVLNGLGADIKKMFFVDLDYKVYKAENIAAGASGICEKVSDNAEYKARFQILKQSVLSYSNEFELNNYRFLIPGEYFAFVDGNPFMKQGFESDATNRKIECYVIGKSKLEVKP